MRKNEMIENVGRTSLQEMFCDENQKSWAEALAPIIQQAPWFAGVVVLTALIYAATRLDLQPRIDPNEAEMIREALLASRVSYRLSPKEIDVEEIRRFILQTKPVAASYIKMDEDTPAAVYKAGNVWKSCLIRSGNDTTTINPAEGGVVNKIFRGRGYCVAKDNLLRILDKVNPAGDQIGIQRKPNFTETEKTIQVYGLNAAFQTIKGMHFTESAYQFDCEEGIYSKDEIVSMMACLVQGSKRFLENNIYHLDVKPDNIGYVEKGVVEYFDLMDALDYDHDPNSAFSWSKPYTLLQDLQALQGNKRELGEVGLEEEKAKELLEKIHIFQLGVVFYALTLRGLPYELTTEGYPQLCSDEIDLKVKWSRNLTCESGVSFTPKQLDTILNMMSKDPKNRPSIAEVAKVFSKDLVRKSNQVG